MARKQKKSDVSDWQVMVDAAKRGLEDEGYKLDRVPGRGLSNVWNISRDGKVRTASIRTTRNRWIAFPPLAGGTKWKTLDDVDLVVVASVDSAETPKNIEVYIFSASEVRKRFDAAYEARIRAGQVVRDDFGMWVGLDVDERDVPTSVGSGIALTERPVATYPLDRMDVTSKSSGVTAYPDQSPAAALGVPELRTISEVMAWTRNRVADLAGVNADAVKLDLKIEY